MAVIRKNGPNRSRIGFRRQAQPFSGSGTDHRHHHARVREAASRSPSRRSGCCPSSPRSGTPDLRRKPFLEAIKRLVLARSYAKVRVLLADRPGPWSTTTDFALARRLTSCIDLRAMSPEYPASAGAFIIADDKALVYRLQRTAGTAFPT